MNIHKISKFFTFFTLALLFSVNLALAANTFNTNLSWNMGSKGTNDVKKLQDFLKSQGLYSGPVTGVFLNQTYKSVVSFQKKYGLDPTGYFGPMTRNVANKLSQNNSITTSASSTTVLDNNSTITLSNSDLQARISSLYEQVWILQKKLRDNQNYSRGGQQGNNPTNSNNQTPQTSGGTNQTSVSPTPTPLPVPPPTPTPSTLPVNTSTSTNSSNNQTLNIDRVAPTVLITSPRSGSVVSGTTVVISVTASDNILVSGVQFKVDNINFGTEDISMPYSVTWNSKSVSNGLHSITAVARDSSGNMATTTMSVNVSNQTVVQTPPPAPTPTPTPTPLPLPPSSPTPTPVTPQASTTVVYPLEITSDGLVTNEYAFFSPTDKKSFFSKYWEMTSGSLYVKNGQYWTGLPDLVEPNYNSSNGTGSSVFRLTTKDSSFQNASVAFNFTLNNLVSDVIDSDTGKAPAWDGAHIFLRYQSETNLYYASFTRRDGTVILKKKCTGGPDNGGTYYDLSSSVKSTLNSGSNLIRADIKNVGSSVKIDLYINGNVIVSATDNGLGCSVISNPGKVGIRGDDANFYFSNFTVQKL